MPILLKSRTWFIAVLQVRLLQNSPGVMRHSVGVRLPLCTYMQYMRCDTSVNFRVINHYHRAQHFPRLVSLFLVITLHQLQVYRLFVLLNKGGSSGHLLH